MDVWEGGVKVSPVAGEDAAIANAASEISMNSHGIMAGGSDAAVAAIKDYLSAEDNPDDNEKVRRIKDTVDPENKLSADELINTIDSLLKKAGKSWTNRRIDQVLQMVVILNSVKSFSNSLNGSKSGSETK